MAYASVAKLYQTIGLLQKSLDYYARPRRSFSAILFPNKTVGGFTFGSPGSISSSAALEALAMLDTARKEFVARS